MPSNANTHPDACQRFAGLRLEVCLAEVLSRTLVQVPSLEGDGHSFTAPSPFIIPDAVRLLTRQPRQIGFGFEYSEEELSEPRARQALLDCGVCLSLSQQSKKVLQVRYAGNIERHIAWRFKFDPEGILCAPDFTPRTRGMCKNSLDLILGILSTLPDEFVQALRDPQPMGPAQIN